MSTRKQFETFLELVETSGRFPKTQIIPPENGDNLIAFTGEVSSRRDHDDIVEMARQHGFHLFAQEVFIPCKAGE
jgi:hypothetical protein